ncbi:hypothetical protein [Burkholderia sp. BCC0044]|uniref:hypothetical protein n=1 Tax=Burkholderia sp. BCC0044 TaxID=2676295 RepID=UPI00158C04B6|nr:hypothetical protein [Burkholderia sp. BCC0044]
MATIAADGATRIRDGIVDAHCPIGWRHQTTQARDARTNPGPSIVSGCRALHASPGTARRSTLRDLHQN